MELNRIVWDNESKNQFIEYLELQSNREKQAWATRMLNTKLDVLVVPTKTMKKIADEIFKGNYRSFLDLKLFNSYETIALYGMLISRIKDFEELKSYLTIYIEQMENWAHCDLLSFNIDNNHEEFIKLSEEYVKSSKVFIRRLGLLIILYLIRDIKYLDYCFEVLSKFEKEDEYYVIMMGGWLLSECIIRYREESLANLKNYKLNPKFVNKGIQKCRESLRLTQEEKDNLLIYKVKK